MPEPMGFRITWGGDPEDVSVEIWGQASVAALDAMCREGLADERARPGMKILFDQRLLRWADMTVAEIRRRADDIAAIADEFGKARVAIVVARPVDYGLQRMLQTFHGDRHDAEFALFYSIDQAREWLAEDG
jgi:hypothetical protein